MSSKKYDSFLSRVEAWQDAHSTHIEQLGMILIDAQMQLTGEENRLLEEQLMNRGLTKSDFKAAKAVAQGKLDGRLFFAGVATSKVMTLDVGDQRRLLDGESLELKTPTGVVFKTWGEMSGQERDQLFGKKGGNGILCAADQELPNKRVKNKTTVIFTKVEYRDSKFHLSRGAESFGEILLSTLVADTYSSDQLGLLIADLMAAQNRLVKRKAA